MGSPVRSFGNPALGASPAGRSGIFGRRGAGQLSSLSRPQALIRQNAFTAPLSRLATRIISPNLLHTPRQVDVERTLKEIQETAGKPRANVSSFLFERIAAKRQQFMTDGWAYFHDGDYRRALAAFDAVEIVDRKVPGPRFGQLMSAVAGGSLRRAMHKMGKLYHYAALQPEGTLAIFEYNVSLQAAFGTPEELERVLSGVRTFAQKNPDNVAVQAMFCYVLWYTHLEDAVIEAASVAERIHRTHPASPWAGLHLMILEAQRKALEAERKNSSGEPAQAAPRPSTPAR